VFCEYLDLPAVLNSTVYHDKNNETISVAHNLLIGKMRTPLSTPYIWHLVSENRQKDANPWMGMYQYLRTRYCEKAGIAAAQPLPTSSHSNVCNPAELENTIKTAGKLNFKRHYIPLCPSPYEKIASQEVKSLYGQISKEGMEPLAWSPCGHTQGMDNDIASGHEDWLVRDKNGKIIQWFGTNPVFDLNNEEYMRHYTDVAAEAIASGLKAVWLDMGGTAAETVNYGKENPKPALEGMMKMIRYYRDNGITVEDEGQNPLCLDAFWYRQNLYANHSGKEFAFTGMSNFIIPPDNFSLDYFRLGMHNAFFYCDITGYACGMERFPDENKLTEEAGRLNQMFNEAIETVGRPFVRQTDFGTYWTSDKGAAIFTWNPVKTLHLTLPDGWKIRKTLSFDGKTPEYKGNVVSNLPHRSVVLITK
jgi:hypothetical protein